MREFYRQRHIASQGRQLLGQLCRFSLFLKTLAGTLGLDLISPRQKLFKGPEFSDELCRALFPDSLDAGDVVTWVSNEGATVGPPPSTPSFSPRTTLLLTLE